MIYGDVNNNGTVEAADAKLAKSLIDTVPTEEELTAADVDDDGKITENDVNLILQAVGNEFYAQLFPCAKAMYLLPTTFRAELCIVTATALPTVRGRTQWVIQHILSAIMLPKNII